MREEDATLHWLLGGDPAIRWYRRTCDSLIICLLSRIDFRIK
jgi:hypothetical protein